LAGQIDHTKQEIGILGRGRSGFAGHRNRFAFGASYARCRSSVSSEKPSTAGAATGSVGISSGGGS
jgi:hypothetical protein